MFLDNDIRITLRRRNKVFVLWALVQILVKSSIHGMQARKDLTIEVHVEGGPKVHKSFVLASFLFKQH